MTGYQLAILHFANNPTSGERIAVGIVAQSDQGEVCGVIGGAPRVAAMYPSLTTEQLSNILGVTDHRIQRATDFAREIGKLDFGTLLEMTVPSTEPCFTWSDAQHGVTNNLHRAVEWAFREYIGRHILEPWPAPIYWCSAA